MFECFVGQLQNQRSRGINMAAQMESSHFVIENLNLHEKSLGKLEMVK